MNLKQLINQVYDLPAVGEGDNVIGVLTDAEKDLNTEIKHMTVAAIRLEAEARKLRAVVVAKQTLLWDMLRKKNELAESAEMRGKGLGVRVDPSTSLMVVVERDVPAAAENHNETLDAIHAMLETFRG